MRIAIQRWDVAFLNDDELWYWWHILVIAVDEDIAIVVFIFTRHHGFLSQGLDKCNEVWICFLTFAERFHRLIDLFLRPQEVTMWKQLISPSSRRCFRIEPNQLWMHDAIHLDAPIARSCFVNCHRWVVCFSENIHLFLSTRDLQRRALGSC